MPYRSRWSISVPTISLPSFVFTSPNALLSDDPIFVDCEYPKTCYLTLHTFREWSKRIAAGLVKAGLQPGDRVLLWSGNSIFFPTVVMGVIMAGGIFTSANPMYVAKELAHQLRDADVKFMLAAEVSLTTALEGAALAGLTRDQVFVFNNTPFDGQGGDSNGLKHWRELISPPHIGKDFKWERLTTDEQAKRTIILVYSSGTTGPPKGVEVSHYNIVTNTIQLMHLQTLDPRYTQQNEPRGLCFLPMYHGLALMYFCLMAPRTGLRVYVMAKYELMPVMENIQKFRISELLIVPPVVVAMAKHPLIKLGKNDLSTVLKVVCGAAPLGREVSEEFEKLWPVGKMKINQAWGMSEAPCMILGWHDRTVTSSTLTSVGELMASCEAKIVDDDSASEVPKGTRGELWCRAPNIMKGYWRNPRATAETITEDGWLKTGDIAYADEAENFFLVDRKKELIKVKGSQVAPADLEAILLEHPDVVDAAVIGARVTYEEERPRAYIVLSPGSSLREREVMKYVEDRVDRAKRITGGVVFLDNIPKNPSGKILRKLLRNRAAVELQSMMEKL